MQVGGDIGSIASCEVGQGDRSRQGGTLFIDRNSGVSACHRGVAVDRRFAAPVADEKACFVGAEGTAERNFSARHKFCRSVGSQVNFDDPVPIRTGDVQLGASFVDAKSARNRVAFLAFGFQVDLLTLLKRFTIVRE